MAVKTITVTEDAYEALKFLKQPTESFSKTLLRLRRKNSLNDFIGILSKESATELKHTIKEMKSKHTVAHQKRMQRIITAFEQGR